MASASSVRVGSGHCDSSAANSAERIEQPQSTDDRPAGISHRLAGLATALMAWQLSARGHERNAKEASVIVQMDPAQSASRCGSGIQGGAQGRAAASVSSWTCSGSLRTTDHEQQRRARDSHSARTKVVAEDCKMPTDGLGCVFDWRTSRPRSTNGEWREKEKKVQG